MWSLCSLAFLVFWNLSIHVSINFALRLLAFLPLTGLCDCGAVQSKIMKHVVRMGSHTEKGNCRIGGGTIARLLALLESSKAFHNVLLRHSIFSLLQVLAGRYKMVLSLLVFSFFCGLIFKNRNDISRC